MEEYNLLCWAKLDYKGEDLKDEELIEDIKGIIEKSKRVTVERNMKFFKEIEKDTTDIRNPEDLVSFVKHTQRIGINYLVSWSVLVDKDVKSLEEAIKWAKEVWNVRARYSEMTFYFRIPDNKEAILLSNSFLDFSKLKIEKTHNSTLFLSFNLSGFERLWAEMYDSFIEEYIQELIDNFLLRAGSIAKPLLKERESLMLDIYHDIRGVGVNWPESKVIRADIKEERQIGEAIKTSVKQILEETNILDTRYFLQRKTAEYLPLFKL